MASKGNVTAKKNAKQFKRARAKNPRALRVMQHQTETLADALAHTSLRPTVQAALTLLDYNKAFGELSIDTLVEDLGKQCELASSGDLARPEALLTAQAHTLDAIFNTLARRAALNMGEYLGACETFLRLALKAQSQCRSTLETLATIKNPPMAGYVRQANIAHGHQQVNNAPATASDGSRARETKIRQSKLLEAQDGERLDTRATGTTIGADSDLETVGEINRTKDARR